MGCRRCPWIARRVVRGASRLQRWSGGALFGVTLWLVLTGFALYYTGNDELRAWTSMMHWGVGLSGLLAWLAHRKV